MATDTEILETLRRIETLVGFIAQKQVREELKTELEDAKKALVYKMTGSHSVKEIAIAAEMSTGAVSGLWQKWEEMGLLEKDGRSYKRIG